MRRFGTMGWNYEDWRGEFYSVGLATARMLSEFVQVFDTVELDTTFYAVPKVETIQNWASQTPHTFRFTAKLPKSLTHDQRLLGAADDANAFAALLHTHLDGRLGGVLVQLPPDFTRDERGALTRFLDKLEPEYPWAVEFRHANWRTTDIADDLAERCITVVTTERVDFGGAPRYLRLLGRENAFARFHTRQERRDTELAQWATRLATESPPDTYVFVRNFYEGHAPGTLFALMEQLGITPPTPPGQQQMSLF